MPPAHHQDHGAPVTEAPWPAAPPYPMPWGGATLPATSTMSPGTMSRARIRCTPLRSARITFPISGSYSFKASMALSAFLSCKQRKGRAAGAGIARASRLLPHPLQRREHPNSSPDFGVHLRRGWGKCRIFFSCSETVLWLDFLILGLGSSTSHPDVLFIIQQPHLRSSYG